MSDPTVAKRNKGNRRRGAQWQVDIRDYLRQQGYDVEELKLQGQQDEGDLVVRLDAEPRFLIIEAKNEARIDLPGYLRELEREVENFAAHRGIPAHQVRGQVWVKQRGKGAAEAYVVVLAKALGEALR